MSRFYMGDKAQWEVGDENKRSLLLFLHTTLLSCDARLGQARAVSLQAQQRMQRLIDSIERMIRGLEDEK